MRESITHLAFWDDELDELDERASKLFGKAAVLRVIARVLPDIESITRGNMMVYRQAVKAELLRLVEP